MKDIELKEVDQTKQLMTRENGCVKVTVPENTAAKYTGLSKDELVKVAGTPGWIRIRWALMALFFLGWVGMLAGAIVIIVQAPRCKPIPEMHWWNEGPLYQISDVNAFTESGLKGLEGKLDYLSQMNVAGVVLGPIHTLNADQLDTLNLISVQSEVGTENELESLLGLAHKKGISIVLNLTPNYNETSAWFNNFNAVAQKIKDACTYWLDKGLDGIFLSDLNEIPTDAWPSIKEIFNRSEATKDVALMGSVNSMSVNDISVLLNRSGVDLLLTGQPDLYESGEKQAQMIKELNSSVQQTSLGWRSRQDLGSLASEFPIRLYQILLFTLPGTPVFSAGEELGLKAEEQLQALWDLENPVEEKNAKAKALQEERLAVRNFFKTLSDLRGKERSLLHGEYVGLSNSKSALAFLRVWDQSKRFITALNWGDKPVTMKLTYRDLPAEAQVLLSTDTSSLALESMVSLEKVQLEPKQAVLLTYPYAG